MEFSTETWSLLAVGGAVGVIGIALLVIFHATGIIQLTWSNFHAPWNDEKREKDNDN